MFASCDGHSQHRTSNRIILPTVDNNEVNIDDSRSDVVQDSELQVGGALYEYLDRISRFDGDISDVVGEIGTYRHV